MAEQARSPQQSDTPPAQKLALAGRQPPVARD
jgi:hypothetical protein